MVNESKRNFVFHVESVQLSVHPGLFHQRIRSGVAKFTFVLLQGSLIFLFADVLCSITLLHSVINSVQFN
jgi:hypothetical protein